MERLLMPTLAVRFDFATVLVQDEDRCRRVAEILMHPCFDDLERVSAHRGDRWINHTSKTADDIVAILRDPANRSAAFDAKRGREPIAGGEIENGTRDTTPRATRFEADLIVPLPDNVEPTVAALCELADALDTGAGFIAAEPDHAHARHIVLGNALPKMRAGLSVRRAIERRGRDWHYKQRHNELAGPEWSSALNIWRGSTSRRFALPGRSSAWS
jgi:hypothetical protein